MLRIKNAFCYESSNFSVFQNTVFFIVESSIVHAAIMVKSGMVYAANIIESGISNSDRSHCEVLLKTVLPPEAKSFAKSLKFFYIFRQWIDWHSSPTSSSSSSSLSPTWAVLQLSARAADKLSARAAQRLTAKQLSTGTAKQLSYITAYHSTAISQSSSQAVIYSSLSEQLSSIAAFLSSFNLQQPICAAVIYSKLSFTAANLSSFVQCAWPTAINSIFTILAKLDISCQLKPPQLSYDLEQLTYEMK